MIDVIGIIFHVIRFCLYDTYLNILWHIIFLNCLDFMFQMMFFPPLHALFHRRSFDSFYKFIICIRVVGVCWCVQTDLW